MQIDNDYDKEVYNGDIGNIDDVDPANVEVIANFDGRTVTYGFGELDMLVPAYAATTHKSQGSEYPAVVIPVMTQQRLRLSRRHCPMCPMGQLAGRPRAKPQELRAFARSVLRCSRCPTWNSRETPGQDKAIGPSDDTRNRDTRNGNHRRYVLLHVTAPWAAAPNGRRDLMRRRRKHPSRSRQHRDRDGTPVSKTPFERAGRFPFRVTRRAHSAAHRGGVFAEGAYARRQ